MEPSLFGIRDPRDPLAPVTTIGSLVEAQDAARLRAHSGLDTEVVKISVTGIYKGRRVGYRDSAWEPA